MKTIFSKLFLIIAFAGISLTMNGQLTGHVSDTDPVYKTTSYTGTLASFNAAVAYFYPASNPCSMCTYTDSISPSFLDGGVIFPNYLLVMRNGVVDQWSFVDSAIFNAMFRRDTSKWYVDKASYYSAAISDSRYPRKNGTSGQVILGDGTFATKTSGTVTSIGLTSSDFSVSGSPITSSGNITADLTTTGVSAGTYDWVTVDSKGRVTAGANTPVPTAIASGGRNFNQAYQISSTRPSKISVSSQMSCSLTLVSGASGEVILEISANGTSGWIYSGQISGSNTGTLTIGLNTAQITGGQLTEDLPSGYYWRLRTNNVSGTPTYTFKGGNERTY